MACAVNDDPIFVDMALNTTLDLLTLKPDAHVWFSDRLAIES